MPVEKTLVAPSKVTLLAMVLIQREMTKIKWEVCAVSRRIHTEKRTLAEQCGCFPMICFIIEQP